jgi:hypothetical protein
MLRLALTFVLIAAACGGSSAKSSTPDAGNTPVIPGPAGLKATPANASVALTWSAVAGATSYQVFRAIPPRVASAQIGTSTTTSFTDTALTNGTFYTYTVTAVTAAGTSEQSGEIDAQPFRELCVADNRTNQIQVFNAEQTDSSPPLREFGSRTALAPSNIDIDPVHGEIFSANGDLDTLTSTAESANGNVAPLRTSTFLPFPTQVTYGAANDELVVVDGSQISAFARTASGATMPVRTLTGTASFGKAVLTGPAHGDRMFVIGFDQSSGFSINSYARADSGAKDPSSVMTSTALASVIASAFAYDPVNDEILVGVVDSGGSGVSVLAFPASGNGPTVPSRVLGGSLTEMVAPEALAVDSANGILYVLDAGESVLSFPLSFGASANIAPRSILSGSLTRISFNAHSIAFDQTLGILAVQSDDNILVFDAAASGNIAPISAINSGVTALDNPGGVAVDLAHGELFVANSGAVPAMTVYDRTMQGGDGAPLRTLATPGFASFTADVAFDAAHDELITATANPAKIDFHARTASGAAAPLRSISGSNTQLRQVDAVALDAVNDAVVVADDNDTILRFARTFTDGNEAPLTSIAGSNTGLSQVQSIFVDDVNAEIFVAGKSGISVFRLTDSGNIAPIRTLSLANSARGVLVDPVANELFVIEEFEFPIRVYSRTATANAGPLRTILAPTAGFSVGRAGMAICN